MTPWRWASASAVSSSAPSSASIVPAARLGHEPAAQDDELERRVRVDRPGGDERRELAERVPGDRHDVVAHVAIERPPAGDARAEDRRLGEAGGLRRAVERVGAHEVQAAVEQLGRMGGDEVAHPGHVAALAGEECGGRHGLHPHQTAPAPVKGYQRVIPHPGGERRTVWGGPSADRRHAAAQTSRPRRCARCTASARLRTPSFL